MKQSTQKLLSMFFCTMILISVSHAQWVQKRSMVGSRDGAVCWVINGKSYVMGGMGMGDLQEYDPSKNLWTVKKPIPHGITSFAMGFVINGKGYLCGGADQNSRYLKSLLEYDPVIDQWTYRKPMPTKLSCGYGMAINNKGYIFCGDDSAYYNVDVFEYDPAINDWTIKGQFPGGPRDWPYGFSVGNKGYFGGGSGGSSYGNEKNDLWEYEPVSDSWNPMPPLPGNQRWAGVSFASDDFGYVGLGRKGNTLFNDLYRFNPDSSTWCRYPNFAGGARGWAVGFAIADTIYAATGLTSAAYQRDLYGFNTKPAPLNPVGIKSLSNSDFKIYVNNVDHQLKLELIKEGSGQVIVEDISGRILFEEHFENKKDLACDIKLPEGVYLVKVFQDNSYGSKKIFVK